MATFIASVSLRKSDAHYPIRINTSYCLIREEVSGSGLAGNELIFVWDLVAVLREAPSGSQLLPEYVSHGVLMEMIC